MARPRSIEPIDDLGLFLRIATLLEEKNSQRDIGKMLDISPAQMREMFGRLQRHYGNAPLVRTMPDSGETELTRSGRRLLTKIRRCLQDPLIESRIRLKLTHSLVQSAVLFPLLTEWMEAEQKKIDVSASVVLDYEREVNELIKGNLDLLVVWGLPQRLHTPVAGVTIEPIGPYFPLALISHSRAILQSCVKDQDALLKAREEGTDFPWTPREIDFELLVKKHRLATLELNKQPLVDELLHAGIRSTGNSPLTTSSFHSIIDLCRAKVCDAGIVPVAGKDLENMQLTHQVFYQVIGPPHEVQGLRIAVARRSLSKQKIEAGEENALGLEESAAFNAAEFKKRNDLVESLLGRIKTKLEEQHSGKEFSISQLLSKAVLLPLRDSDQQDLDPAFFASLKHGYYLWPDEKRGVETVRWMSEDVRFCFRPADPGSASSGLTIDAMQSVIENVKNERKETYRVEFAHYRDQVFHFTARKQDEASCGFAGTFNARVSLAGANDEPLPPIVVGHWCGGAGQSRVATWGLIFSAVPLDDDALSVIAQRAALTYVLHAE